MCGRQNVNNTETGPGAALIEDANERMRGKSAEPVEQCQPNGELALCESIEILSMESLDISPFFSHFAALFGSLTYCLIITCNMTVLLTIALDRQLHKPMYLLLINLPINDMIGATALFPHLIHSIVSQSTSISNLACYLQALLVHLYCGGSLIILTVMAFDRYLAICRPLRYHTLMTASNLRWIIAGMWLTDVALVGSLFLMLTRFRLCSWRLADLYCNNPSLVKLACENTTANNV
ncbi:unnamed protein product [Gadus morhua 'NCC']